MHSKWIFSFLLFSSLYGTDLKTSEGEWKQRLRCFSILHDRISAIKTAVEALSFYPTSEPIYIEAIKVYAQAGEEEAMMKCYRSYENCFPLKNPPRELLEEMAWGIIEKGSLSSSPLIRAMSMIAAAIGNDARGVALLARNISDANRVVRNLTIEFASHFRDSLLQEAILAQLAQEKDVMVRIQLLKAIGEMQIIEGESNLLAILEKDKTSAEEKGTALESIALLRNFIDRKTLEKFVKSPKFGLRALAAVLISYNEQFEDVDLLLPLLGDSHPEVRKEAIDALGILRIGNLREISILDYIKPLAKDPCPEVALTAIWAIMLNSPREGQKLLHPWFSSEKACDRLYAAAILSRAGKYGFPLVLQQFKTSKDPFVRLNLGQALIRQRVQIPLAAKALHDFINNNKERIMKKSFGSFDAIAPCEIDHKPNLPNYPEALNQITRLEILNELAMLEYPKTVEAIHHFLRQHPWGVSGAAVALLLTEGDETALAAVRELLKDPLEKIRLQAALVLGLWGSDREALSTLQEMYPKATKNQKEQILEALGKIGDPLTIPFLVDRLEEPQETLRLIAATALIQTLYH